VGRALDQMSSADFSKLQEYVTAAAPQKVATMCSGTDSPVLVLRALSAALSKRCITWKPRHVFSAEKDAKKRSFLQAMMGDSMEHLFHDCTALDSAAMCDVHRSRVPVPVADFLYAGFPCQDVSLANPHRKRNVDDVCSGELRTGKVFQEGVLKYLKQHSAESQVMQLAILENVVGLAAKSKVLGHFPLDWVSNSISEVDHTNFVFQLDPTDFGFGFNRPRLWMIVIPNRLLRGVMDQEEAEELLKSYMASLCRAGQQEPVSLHSVLSPEDHDAGRLMRELAERRPVVTCQATKRSRNSSWIEKHVAHCDRKGEADVWSSGIPDAHTQALWPTLRNLSAREFDILRVRGISAFPEKELRAVSVNDSIDRAQVRPYGAAGMTLTTSIRCYLSDRCRLMTGVEAMAGQGIHFGSLQRRLGDFSDRFLIDLAGNAFHCWCCSAATVAALQLLAELHRRRHQSPSARCAAEAPPEDADLDDVWGTPAGPSTSSATASCSGELLDQIWHA